MNENDILNMSDDEFTKNEAVIRERVFNTESSEEQETLTEESISEEDVSNTTEEMSESLDHIEEESDVSEQQEESQEEDSIEENEENDPASNYEAFYNELTQPFKASGQDIVVDNPAKIRELMQKGIDYHKKLNMINGNLSIIKTLEKEGLNNKDTLNMLIDVYKGNPEAIKKIIKDKGVELDLYDEETTEYTPNNHMLDSTTASMIEHIQELRESSSDGAEALNIINGWDQGSFNDVVNDLNLFNSIKKHIHHGLFKDTINEITKLRILGDLPPGNDLEVYDLVSASLLQENKDKYIRSTTPQPKVVGNSKELAQKNSKKAKNNDNKQLASIVSNTSHPTYTTQPMSEMRMDDMPDDLVESSDSFEDFLKKYIKGR